MESTPCKKAFSKVALLGRWLGPLSALLIYLVPVTVENPAARDTAAVGSLMAVYWITGATALPATSLIPLVAFPLLGILPIKSAAAPYASPTIYLFLGGFMMATAIERWGLHRRLALGIFARVGTRPASLVGGFLAATAFASMWISNTATVVMMIPIARSIVALMRDGLDESKSEATDDFENSLLLSIAFGASIGGLGTLVGTPANAVMAGFLTEKGIAIGFGRWMLFGIPIVIGLLFAAWIVLTRWPFHLTTDEIPGGREFIDAERDRLGAVSRGEWTVLLTVTTTIALWIFREPLVHCQWLLQCAPWVTGLSDATIAIAGAVTLFVIPVDSDTGEAALDWPTASRLPWGVLVLIGGGLSLAAAVRSSGLDAALGTQLHGLTALPPFVMVVILTLVVVFLTEVTSNTATAAALIPVLFELGTGLPGGPLQLVVPATLAASCAFMLPVATPPNAIVFGTDRVSSERMMQGGIWLNLAATVLIPLAMYGIGSRLPG